jgi:hypothetical protein
MASPATGTAFFALDCADFANWVVTDNSERSFRSSPIRGMGGQKFNILPGDNRVILDFMLNEFGHHGMCSKQCVKHPGSVLNRRVLRRYPTYLAPGIAHVDKNATDDLCS